MIPNQLRVVDEIDGTFLSIALPVDLRCCVGVRGGADLSVGIPLSFFS